jgi:flagellar biosynthesis anti-sigma factor FlgM
MRIDLTPKGPESPDESKRISSGGTNAKAKPTSASNASDETSDRAELSPDQTRVRALASQVSDLPEIRQERVAALSAAVRNGSYNVSPDQTAKAMMTEMLGNAA